MAYLFPRMALTPARCAPLRHDFAPLFSLFDDATRQFEQLAARQHRQHRRPFNPRFDVKENQASYILEGEVPGFKDADLSVEWNDNVLAIRGRHETVTESGTRPQSLEAPASTPAVEAAPAEQVTTSETNSVKSHQATVEDEEPSNTPVAVEPTKEVVADTNTADATPAQPEAQHWICERSTGAFLRQFSFPSNAVNHEAIKASLQSGILRVVVPKAEAQASRRINIE